MIRCNCGGEVKQRSADGVESHGETHTDEWYECTRCGARYEEYDLEDLQEC